MDGDYSKREIDAFMENISASLKAMTAENIASHTKLDENQKITNGKIADVQKWRERVTGAGWAIGIVGTIVLIPMLTWAFIAISKIPDTIEEEIKEALMAQEL